MLKKTIRPLFRLTLSAFVALGVLSCKVEEKLPSLSDRIAGATDVITSPSGRYFYVLNSDYERRFDKGSLLIIDSEAAEGSQKLGAISTKRMGRSLSIAQNHLIVTYSDTEARQAGSVEIWNLANEVSPQKVAEFDVSCQPLNAIIAPTTPYAAVICTGGALHMVKNPKNTADAPITTDYVRYYEGNKRGLYFYETAGKTYLFGFPVDLEGLNVVDQTLEDSKQYDIATDSVLPGANGVPDAYEETEGVRRRPGLRSPYQMFIYPVSDEETASQSPQDPSVAAFRTFRYLPPGTFTKPTLSNQELKFIHYTLLEANGQTSPTETIVSPNIARYRSNFWEAKIGPENNSSIFYVSQRGDYNSESNNVLRFTINPSALAEPNTAKFADLFTVERVYGFAIDRDNGGRFPSDFEFATLNGQNFLFVNSFRDLIYFANAPFYSVTRKALDAPASTQETPSSRDSTDFSASFYNLAVSSNGKVLTSSFYGDVLYLFDGSPSVTIKDQTPLLIP